MCHVVQQQAAIPSDILSTQKKRAVISVKLGPTTRAAGYQRHEIAQLATLPIRLAGCSDLALGGEGKDGLAEGGNIFRCGGEVRQFPTSGNVSVQIRFNPNGVVSTVECEGRRNPVGVGKL